MFKRIALILAAVVAGALGAVTISAPAQADSPCLNRICWFDGENWNGNMYIVNPSSFPSGTCFNLGTDPNTGINWNNRPKSLMWNDILYPDSYVEFYDGLNCTVIAITRAGAWPPVDYQMQSCTEPAAEWNGPCGPISSVLRRPSSWAFQY